MQDISVTQNMQNLPCSPRSALERENQLVLLKEQYHSGHNQFYGLTFTICELTGLANQFGQFCTQQVDRVPSLVLFFCYPLPTS